MDIDLINSKELEQKVKEVWKSYQVENRDVRVNWDLAWGGIKRQLQEEKKK